MKHCALLTTKTERVEVKMFNFFYLNLKNKQRMIMIWFVECMMCLSYED